MSQRMYNSSLGAWQGYNLIILILNLQYLTFLYRFSNLWGRPNYSTGSLFYKLEDVTLTLTKLLIAFQDARPLWCFTVALWKPQTVWLNPRHAILLSHDMPKAIKHQWVVGCQTKHSLQLDHNDIKSSAYWHTKLFCSSSPLPIPIEPNDYLDQSLYDNVDVFTLSPKPKNILSSTF
jgi:hypothetical protein